MRNHLKPMRYAVGILFPVGILLSVGAAISPDIHLPCYFHELTGLYCAGCGSGRAVAAVMRGHLKEAFLFNPMLFVLGIPAFLILAHEYIRLVFPYTALKPVRLSNSAMRLAILLITGFWVLRNIPCFSFLAP